MKEDAYQLSWRTNYEAISTVFWFLSALIAIVLIYISEMPEAPFIVTAGITSFFGLKRFSEAFSLYQVKSNLKGKALAFLGAKESSKHFSESKKEDSLWLGWGFEWSQRHCQASYEIIKRDAQDILPDYHKHQKGAPWIHGIEMEESSQALPLNYADSHCLITGATGSGKTRLFDTLVTQCVMRGEAVIIIDPKGDQDLRALAKKACELSGEPERFVNFHPGFPEDSARINLIANFNRPTEVASRIAGLIVTESASDPFKNFCQMAVNNIVQGQLLCHERPLLTTIRRYLESGPAPLVVEAITWYCDKVMPDWRKEAAGYINNSTKDVEKKAAQLIKFYREKVQPDHPSSDLEGVLSMFAHDRTHFAKMVASLLPVLGMLTSGAMGELLSPTAGNIDDTRPLRDTKSIINNRQCAYVGLDSLTDAMVGSSIGTLFLADLASVAGDRYNYGINNNPVNIFVDEASEVICDQLIQLLNKGRGSKMRLFVATQTIQDFVARMGNEAKAYQVLGNVNNTISLRVKEDKTQEYIANQLPETRVRYVMRTQGISTVTDSPESFGGNHGERLMEEAVPMFIPQLLGQLPDLEYIAVLASGKMIKGRLPILKYEEDAV